MSEADDVADAIEQNGQPVTLRRLAPHGIRFDVTVAAMVRQFRAAEMSESVIQGDRRVVIGNREIVRRQWPGPPKMGDQVIIGDKTATLTANAETISIGDDIVKYVMQIRGG